MAGVVFVIGAAFPEHWQRALQVGYWETVSRKNVVRGDLLVFWQAGRSKRLLGTGIATLGTEDVDYSLQSRPWLPSDPTSYRYRYRFLPLAGATDTNLRWPELMELVGRNPKQGANTAPVQFDVDGTELLGRLDLRVPAGTASPGERIMAEAVDTLFPTTAWHGHYRPADEGVAARVGVVFQRDPEAVDRGLRGHAATQNAAARWLTEHGAEVLSPKGTVNYDLAWRQREELHVGEVKSLHPLNETHQLRLGIGQVLEYAHRLPAKPALIVEREPSAPYWVALCEELQIRLAWPGKFETLLT